MAQLEKLLGHAKIPDAATLQRLLDLEKVPDAATLQRLLDREPGCSKQSPARQQPD